MAKASVHVALLRGINVGGKHRVPMKRLAAIFTELGAGEVQTYIQSGNVIYRATAAEAKTMPARAAAAIEAAFGFAVPVVGRSARQLATILAQNPYLDESDEPKQLHVALLDRKPTAAALARLDPDRSPPDRYTLVGRDIYLLCPKGLARTKLSCDYFDRTLERTSTMRNWRTMTKLVELSQA